MVDPLRESRRLDEELKKLITKDLQIRRHLLKNLNPRELLDHMDIAAKEQIVQDEINYGKSRAAGTFLSKVHCYSGWGKQFLDALYYTEHIDLARRLKPDYEPPVDDDWSSDGASFHGAVGNFHKIHGHSDQAVHFQSKMNLPPDKDTCVDKSIHERDQSDKFHQCSSNPLSIYPPPSYQRIQPFGCDPSSSLLKDANIHKRGIGIHERDQSDKLHQYTYSNNPLPTKPPPSYEKIQHSQFDPSSYPLKVTTDRIMSDHHMTQVESINEAMPNRPGGSHSLNHAQHNQQTFFTEQSLGSRHTFAGSRTSSKPLSNKPPQWSEQIDPSSHRKQIVIESESKGNFVPTASTSFSPENSVLERGGLTLGVQSSEDDLSSYGAHEAKCLHMGPRTPILLSIESNSSQSLLQNFNGGTHVGIHVGTMSRNDLLPANSELNLGKSNSTVAKMSRLVLEDTICTTDQSCEDQDMEISETE